MSVTDVRPANTGLSGQTRGTDAASAVRGHRATFRVAAAAGDTWDIIDQYFRSTGSLPYPGRVFDVGNGHDTRSRCTGLSGNQVPNSEGRWLVEATFEEQLTSFTGPTGNDGKASDDPNDWHDEIEVSTSQISIAVERALYTGNSIGAVGPFIFPGRWIKPCNSTGKPLDPGIEEELDITVIRLTKYQRGYGTGFYTTYINTVNSDLVVINKPDYLFTNIRIAPSTAKMKAINSSYHVTDKGIRYWKHTLEIHINVLTWRRQILDRGTCPRLKSGDVRRDGTTVTANDIPANGNFVDEEIKDSDGTAISEPVNFNGRGQEWREADRPPVYLFFQTLREVPWSGIPW